MTDPTGAHAPRPDAAQRTDLPTAVSAARPGGLLALGTRVEITQFGGVGFLIGEIIDKAASPDGYLALRLDDGSEVVVFTGPGILVRPAPAGH